MNKHQKKKNYMKHGLFRGTFSSWSTMMAEILVCACSIA